MEALGNARRVREIAVYGRIDLLERDKSTTAESQADEEKEQALQHGFAQLEEPGESGALGSDRKALNTGRWFLRRLAGRS